MLRKFFQLDKNYLLEKAQLELKDQLLFQLFDLVIQTYEQQQNPLGWGDDFSLKIKNYKLLNLEPLEEFYYKLAGVYRFKWGANQLEFLWDGSDHQEKYKSDWTHFFETQIRIFCRQELFIQAVLDLTVFLPENRTADLAENRMNHFMLQHFEVKFHKSRGLVAMKVA